MEVSLTSCSSTVSRDQRSELNPRDGGERLEAGQVERSDLRRSVGRRPFWPVRRQFHFQGYLEEMERYGDPLKERSEEQRSTAVKGMPVYTITA